MVITRVQYYIYSNDYYRGIISYLAQVDILRTLSTKYYNYLEQSLRS